MKNGLNQTTATYSSRSQRSLLEEDRLRGNLEKIDGLIRHTERKIADLEKDKARTLAQIPTGKVNQTFLSFTLEALEDNGRKLAAYKEERASAEKVIANLAPSPAQAAERAERQNYLANLAAERLQKDRLVEGALNGFRRLLKERAELTAKMLKAAEAVDFTVGDDGLDGRRFDDLLGLLPGQLAASSERWAQWVLAKGESLKSYIVRDEVLTIPETLAHHGVLRFGDRVDLNEDQVRDLLRKDRPARTQTAPWRHLPPSIMTVEDYGEVLAMAKKKGVPVQEICFWEDVEGDTKARDRFTRLEEGADLSIYEDPGEPFKVRVRASRQINFSDRAYVAGELLEYPGRKWSLCRMAQEGEFERP